MIDDSSDQLAARRAAKAERAERTAEQWKSVALEMSRALQAVAMFSQAALSKPNTRLSTLARLTEDLAAHVLVKHGFPVSDISAVDAEDDHAAESGGT